MVLSVLIAFGAVVGASEGLKASQQKARREEHRSRKNNLIVHVPKSSEYSKILDGRRVVLSGDKLYIDTGLDNDIPFGHPFEGYYLGYPESNHPGLVSTITDEAPIMNWIYMHAGTYELKFGTRQYSEAHLTGPFDCTRQDRRMTLAGYESFVAVKEGDFWALYFDWDGDRLQSKVPPGTPVVDIDLERKELRSRKPRRQPQQEQPASEGRVPNPAASVKSAPLRTTTFERNQPQRGGSQRGGSERGASERGGSERGASERRGPARAPPPRVAPPRAAPPRRAASERGLPPNPRGLPPRPKPRA